MFFIEFSSSSNDLILSNSFCLSLCSLKFSRCSFAFCSLSNFSSHSLIFIYSNSFCFSSSCLINFKALSLLLFSFSSRFFCSSSLIFKSNSSPSSSNGLLHPLLTTRNSTAFPSPCRSAQTSARNTYWRWYLIGNIILKKNRSAPWNLKLCALLNAELRH